MGREHEYMYPFPSEHPFSVQIVDFHHPSFYFNKYLLSSIVDKDKIRQILSELIAAFSLSIGILMLSCAGKRDQDSLFLRSFHTLQSDALWSSSPAGG